MSSQPRSAPTVRRIKQTGTPAQSEPYVFPTLALGMLRRRPIQRRGFERVISILDACESLLNTHHFEEIGTAEIAKQARLKVGTLYFFFDDRSAIFTCLIGRVLSEIRDQFAAEPVEGGLEPDRYVSLLLQRLTAVWQQHAPLMTLYHSFQHKPEIRAQRDELQRFAVERLTVLLRQPPHAVEGRRARSAAWVVYDLMMSCLDAGVHLAEGQHPEVAREWRRAIAAYISSLAQNP